MVVTFCRCCQVDHNFDGTGPGSAPCDKVKLRPLLESMIRAKMRHLKSNQQIVEWRILECSFGHSYLRALPPSEDEASAKATNEMNGISALKARVEWGKQRGEAYEMKPAEYDAVADAESLFSDSRDGDGGVLSS